MFDVCYEVEGVSKREYTSKKTNKPVKGYSISVAYPMRFGIGHADIWVGEELYIEKPIHFGDVLKLAIAPSGQLLDYIIVEKGV